MKYKRGTIELNGGKVVTAYYPLTRIKIGLAVEHYDAKCWRVIHINTNRKICHDEIPTRNLAKSVLEAIKDLLPWDKCNDEDMNDWIELYRPKIERAYRIADLVCKYQQPFTEVLDFTDKLLGGNVDVPQKN